MLLHYVVFYLCGTDPIYLFVEDWRDSTHVGCRRRASCSRGAPVGSRR